MSSTSDVISIKKPKSPVAEAFRTLRTNIQFSSLDKELKSIVITSSGPNEGKTTIISNLAVTMAQSGSKVLLIDCDLRKSQIHNHFGLNNHKGLTNVLAQQIPLEEVLKKTAVMGLDVLTAGPKPPNPSELLGSNTMKIFIQSVAQDYDRILLDAPPIGVVTDAAVLSSIADGTILTVAAGQVTIEAAKRSKELLEKVNTNILGVVMNKVPVEGKDYYGYYYYYSEDRPKPKSRRKK